MTVKSNAHLQSTDFCLFLLNLFTPEKTSWGVRELATYMDKSPSVIQRALNTLTLHELVVKNSSGRYQLGLKCIHLGNVAQQELRFDQQMQQCLSPWQQLIDLPLFFYSAQHYSASCLYVGEKSQILQLTATLGHTLALHSAPVAQIILANKEEAFIQSYLASQIDASQHQAILQQLNLFKAQGYAYSAEVLFKGTHSLSVPVFNMDGLVVGALSVASTIQEGEASLMKHLEHLTQAARGIQPLFI